MGQLLAQDVTETALKAAFLLNFAKFTEWPAEVLAPTAPLTVCTFGNEMATALESAVAARPSGQRSVIVVRVAAVDQGLRTCSVLYAGKVDRARTAAIVDRLRGASVLVVGDDKEFAIAGGTIGLFVADGRMRFAINVSAAEQARLRLGAQLLSLAAIVKD